MREKMMLKVVRDFAFDRIGEFRIGEFRMKDNIDTECGKTIIPMNMETLSNLTSSFYL